MGGDIRVKGSDNGDHVITSDDLGTSQTQVVKLQLGGAGQDGGLASEDNPFPTQDKNIGDLYNLLSFFLDRLEFGLLTDNSKRLKVNIDAGTLPTITTVGTVTTVTTVTTVGTITNQSRIGDVQAQRVVEAQMDSAFNTGLLSKITF